MPERDLDAVSRRSDDPLVAAIVDRLRHIDTLDEVPGARLGLPTYNVLWDAASLIEREFGDGACGNCHDCTRDD
jgi:hypothetical protein